MLLQRQPISKPILQSFEGFFTNLQKPFSLILVGRFNLFVYFNQRFSPTDF